ncbi:MAG: aminotransferase class V-fold PLP-dependent enzyme [Pseudolabrys sp.]
MDFAGDSGHKLHVRKGIGVLSVRRKPGLRLTPLFDGGEAEAFQHADALRGAGRTVGPRYHWRRRERGDEVNCLRYVENIIR